MKYVVTVHLPCTAEEYIFLKDHPPYKKYQVRHNAVLVRVSKRKPRSLTTHGFVCRADVSNLNHPSVLRLSPVPIHSSTASDPTSLKTSSP